MGKSRLQRQSESRRRLFEGESSALDFLRGLVGWPLLILGAFIFIATAIVLSGEDQFPYGEKQPLEQPVFARVAFERINELRTSELRKTAQQLVPNYYRLNQGLVDRIQAEFLDLHAGVKAAEDFEKFQKTGATRWQLDAAGFDRLKLLTDEAGSAQFKRDVENLGRDIRREHMIERPEPDREIRSTAGEVQIDKGEGQFLPLGKERLTYVTNPEHVRELAKRLTTTYPAAVRSALRAIIQRQLEPGQEGNHFQPVYVYDREHTRSQIAAAAVRDDVVVKDSYQPGDLLVRNTVLNGEEVELLRAEHEAYLAQRSSNPALSTQWRLRQLGIAGLILLVGTALAIYTNRYQPRIVRNPARAAAFCGLLLAMMLVNRLMVLGNAATWSVGPVTVTVAVLTIAYSQRFAIGASAILALLTVLAIDGSIGLLMIHLTVIGVSALLLREIRTRLKMVKVGVLTALAAGGSALFVGLTTTQPFQYVLDGAMWAFAAALAGISVIFVLLPIIEKAFRIATSLTLLEWADTSTPLLKQLIQKAPGTWQHSHLLGSMAEAASEEIGANGLLVRVGAYYHDIGKMCKPNYFVENQRARINAHENLAPTMSLLVILAHVKDGLALAREHGLPPVLHQFIAEHHGTTVVKYFHSIAAQRAAADGLDEREVSETEFRYPGPKPRSRESAILMLCDGVEGAVRALQEPTPGRIETVVHEIVMARLMDGQLDDCDFTLKELSRVEQSLVKSLCAIHHGRIAYPKSSVSEKKIPMPARSA